MSRFKVKASLDNTTRTVEIERQKYDFSSVRDRTAKAFGISNVNIRYTSSTNESFYITNDAQLQKAIKDAEKSGAKNLEVKVFKDASGAPSSSAPTSTASSVASRSIPSSTPTPATTSAAKPVAPTPTVSGSLLVFRLPGIPSSASDRVVVDPQTFQDHFLFSVKPGKFDTDIEVTLTGNTLSFLTTHSIQEAGGTKIMKGTQGITLPLSPTPQQVQVVGQQIKVFYR